MSKIIRFPGLPDNELTDWLIRLERQHERKRRELRTAIAIVAGIFVLALVVAWTAWL